jgi:hypothetical protein
MILSMSMIVDEDSHQANPYASAQMMVVFQPFKVKMAIYSGGIRLVAVCSHHQL